MSQPSARHSRLVRRLPLTLAVLVACSQDPTGSGAGGLPPHSPALVSAPVTGAPGGAAGLRLGVAYVSMVPGTDPAGVSVTVRNGYFDAAVYAPMLVRRVQAGPKRGAKALPRGRTVFSGCFARRTRLPSHIRENVPHLAASISLRGL